MRWICVYAMLFAASPRAQDVDLTKPPQTPPPADFKLPPTSDRTLPNGLRIVAVEDKRVPLVSFRLGFQAGTKYDPPQLSGLAEMAGNLLKEGTKTRTSRQIADDLATIGGNVSIQAAPDSLVMAGSVLSENLGTQLQILADLVRNSTFPKEEIELWKENRKQELLDARSRSETMVEERFLAALYGTHPYGRMLPTAESIDRIDQAALAGYRDRFLIPNNAILVLVGDLPSADQLTKLVQEQFGAWEKKEKPKEPEAVIPPPRRTLVLVDRPGSVQADVRVGHVAVTRTSPDYFPLQVANGIFGGGTSSRIFMNIRERLGYAYQADSVVSPMKDSGYFMAVTQVRNEVIEPALTALFKEMERMGKEPVTAEELSGIKNYLSGVFVMRLSTPPGVASELVSVRMMGLTDDYLERYVTRVRNVEPAGIQSVAKKFLQPADAAIVVVGDASKIEKGLEKFGTVKVERDQ